MKRIILVGLTAVLILSLLASCASSSKPTGGKSTNGGDNWAASSGGLTNSIVWCLAIDPSNPQILYAGTDGGGICKSSDGGTNWAASSSGLTNSIVWSLVLDPDHTQTLYAGTDGGGVCKSANGGANWVSTGLKNQGVFSLAVDPSNPQILYAGTLGMGLWKSSDGGVSWAASSGGLTYSTVFSVAIDLSNSQILYAGTLGEGLWKSSDGGVNWFSSSSGLMNIGVFSLPIDPSNSQILYAGTLGEGVWKSSDGGASWVDSSSGLTNSTVRCLVIDSTNPQILYAGTEGGGVCKSTNGGGSWSASSSGLTNSGVLVVAIDPSNPQTLYAGTDGGGVYKSTNGRGSGTDASATAVFASFKASMVVASTYHSMALKEDGTVWAWGYNNASQLGIEENKCYSPVQVTALGSDVVALTLGAWHSMALKEDGTVWGWGENNHGELGLGDFANRVTPEQVTALGSDVAALVAGGSHSMALKEDGTIWAWGYNYDGQLGLGDTTTRSTPVQITALGNDVAALVAGWIEAGLQWSAPKGHSLALKKDGTVWAWGNNSSGQLGLGDTIDRSTPVQVTALGSDVAALTAGGYHSLALKKDGTVWVWGDNNYDQLGLGDDTYHSTPVQVTALGSDVAAMTAALRYSLALKKDGTVWAWGDNGSGLLGLGDTNNHSTPVQVTALGSDVAALTAGEHHSLALKKDGTIWACGFNGYGELGLGDTTSRSSPVQVPTILSP